ncbi:MAG: hypothetical protein J7527_13475, partial [Chitinophagaceae bacterium]|nr:hypothetical protein [Chitinophagaceae bacterium]
MRINPLVLLAALLCAGSSFAQDSSSYTISLRSGNVIPARDVSDERVASFNQLSSRSAIPRFMLIQFEQLPDESEKRALAASGIELLEYVPHNTYTATVRGPMNGPMLRTAHVRSLISLEPEQKMTPQLRSGMFPARTLKVAGKVDLWITYPQTVAEEDVNRELTAMGVEIIPTFYARHRIVAVRIAKEKLRDLASLGFVEYVQPAPGEDVM